MKFYLWGGTRDHGLYSIYLDSFSSQLKTRGPHLWHIKRRLHAVDPSCHVSDGIHKILLTGELISGYSSVCLANSDAELLYLSLSIDGAILYQCIELQLYLSPWALWFLHIHASLRSVKLSLFLHLAVVWLPLFLRTARFLSACCSWFSLKYHHESFCLEFEQEEAMWYKLAMIECLKFNLLDLQ